MSVFSYYYWSITSNYIYYDKLELILQKDSSYLYFSTGEISLRPI